MAIELNTGRVQSKNLTKNQRVFTKQQKEKLIQRFKIEMENKEREFQDSIDKEIQLLRLKFDNRLNKILRKFWDVKIEDVLKIEREMKNDTPLTLFNVIQQLQKADSLKERKNADTE